MKKNANIRELFYTFDLFRGMRENRLEYIYRGFFSEAIIESLMQLAESNLLHDPSSLTTRKRLYFLMIESLQNITRHQSEQTLVPNEKSGLFIIRREKNKYYLTTGNMVHSTDIFSLEENIKRVNNFTKEELKIEYREILDHGEISEKGGAGLGLIGMARKSGNKLQYAFKTHDEFRSYFYLNLLLFQDDNELEREPVTDYFENIGYIHHILNQKNIVLNYCGSFGAVSRANVKKLFRLQKQTPEVILQLTEITELLTLNIEQHAAQADAHSSPALGILIISMFPDHYKITTGNYINQCSTKQLEIELGNKRIADNGNATSFQSDPAHELSGLEKALLISNTAVVWEIQSVNDTLSFLSLQYTLHFDLPTTPPDQATATID